MNLQINKYLNQLITHGDNVPFGEKKRIEKEAKHKREFINSISINN